MDVLSKSWDLIHAIERINDRIEESRENGSAFKFLYLRASSFLEAIKGGLAESGRSPYHKTIQTLEQLLRDILTESTEYTKMKAPKRVLHAPKTKHTILALNMRLDFFVHTFLARGYSLCFLGDRLTSDVDSNCCPFSSL